MTRGSSRTAVFAAIAIAALAACTTDAERERAGESIGSKLTRGLRFPRSKVFDAPMPEPTDQRAKLLPLGPTVLVLPGDDSLMALRVQDPEARAPEATLIQFADAPSYVRVEVPEGQGAHVVQNGFSAQDDLCEGLCDAVFTVTVTEAIEFEDGAISQTTTRQIVLDCRQHGDDAECDDSDPSAMTEDALCGDVTAGEIVWTSDPVLDAHLEAVRLLGDAAEAAAETLDSIRADMSAVLAVDGEEDSALIAGALTAAIEAHTQDGLSLQLGEQGCALMFAQVSQALERCDADAADAVVSLGCSGLCQPIGDVASCASAETRGCRGLVDDAQCAGSCLGACQVALEEPGECAGTCVGSCDGECPGSGDACDGPCAGTCAGVCTAPSSGACAGECTGLCEVAVEAVPECDAPLLPYCAAPSGGALDCAGDCFGPGMVEIGGGPCSRSALAVGRVLPRCEPALVQLSFAFQPGLEGPAQDDFAVLVQELNAPLAQVVGLLARVELLVVANDELLDAAGGEIADHFGELQDGPETGGLACAARRLPEAAAWLEREVAVLAQLRDDAAMLVTLIVTE
jgi:hypothetical protein